ncbi:MAG: ABC-F family ATP-binding cassette domain-containing protein [Lachnospiraceae bacterium]|nr:ABC-F family ATP-binding cassette domain-containing protein [Lachnospiraceae bacterium]
MVLSCQGITKSYGTDNILNDISFQLDAGEKLAIVGNNGAGKSTLLKIITGELEADKGNVVTAKDVTIGYLAQYQNDAASGTIYDIVYSAREDIINIKNTLIQMEEQMTHLTGDELEELLAKYHSLNDTFEHLEGSTYESQVTGVLRGLGFDDEDFGKNMRELSGGQKTRVSLGMLLVKKPDILLLDEPINHLDLNSIQWLETYLSNYKGTMILVAHDRYFLDKIVDKVLDITHGLTHLYKGNYSSYAIQKAEILKTRLREYEKQQSQIEHQQEVIDKLKSFNREKSVKRAESRQKALDKMDVIDAPISAENHMKLNLEPQVSSGKDVLDIKGLKKSYDDNILFENFDFLLQKGEHVAIIGDNGTGKTTLLKIINEAVDADSGIIKLGSNVHVGYYDQEQQRLNDDNSLFDEIADAYPNLNNTKIRNTLAAFLFTGDDCYKKIGDLSGGERGRVSLAKLMLSEANFLILDEPTNHLDMESKDILEEALNSYTGTLLYVSHDRYFVNKTAHKILELEGKHFTTYLGNYDYYLEKKQTIVDNFGMDSSDSLIPNKNNSTDNKDVVNFSEQKNSGLITGGNDSNSGKADWEANKQKQREITKAKRELAEVEKRIEEIEAENQEIDSMFAQDEVATNSAKLNELTTRQNALNDELEKLYDKWEELEALIS